VDRSGIAAVAGMIAAALLAAPAAVAQTEQMQQTAQCVLQATRDTRSPLAVQLIRTACNQNVVFTGELYQKQQAYNECLIQNLSGAQSDAAAASIQSACRTAYPR